MIQGLWDLQAEAIIDVKLENADLYPYKYEPMAALLAWRETTNKDKHSKHCNNQRTIFTVCYFCLWNDREGSPGRTCAIESVCGSEKGRTTFVGTGVGKRSV